MLQEVPELTGEKVRIPVAAINEGGNRLRRQRATLRGVHYRSPSQEVIRRHTQSTLRRTERLQNLLKTVKTRELIHAQQRLILRRQEVRVVAHRPGVPATYQGNRRYLGMFQGTSRILRTGTSHRVCRRGERAPLCGRFLPRHLPQLIGGIVHLILAVQNLRKRLTVRLETNHHALKNTLHRR